jgi:hypothetical protein
MGKDIMGSDRALKLGPRFLNNRQNNILTNKHCSGNSKPSTSLDKRRNEIETIFPGTSLKLNGSDYLDNWQNTIPQQLPKEIAL